MFDLPVLTDLMHYGDDLLFRIQIPPPAGPHSLLVIQVPKEEVLDEWSPDRIVTHTMFIRKVIYDGIWNGGVS